MKKAKAKLVMLILGVAAPGFFAWSCSGTLSREIRDAAVAGLAGYVEGQTITLLECGFTACEEE